MGYRVKPFTMAVRDNSTQQFIDVGLLGSDVDADVETLNLKTNWIVTPQMFGAVGDGTTDDTAAFSAAIAAKGTSGVNTITIPDGTYLLSSLNIPSNTYLVGAGHVVLKATSNAEAKMIQIGPSRQSNVKLENLIIDGSNVSSTQFVCDNLEIVGCEFINIHGYNPIQSFGDYVYITRNYIHDSEADCIAVNGDNNVVYGNIIVNPNDTGIVVAAGAKNAVVSDNIILQDTAGMNGAQGIAITDVENVVVSGNVIDLNNDTKAGIRVYKDPNTQGTPKSVIISSNHIKNCASGGVVIAGNADNVQILGNNFSNCNVAVRISTSTNIIVSDNIMYCTSTGVLEEGSTEDITIKANKLHPVSDGTNLTFGIRFTTASTNVNITDNDLSECATPLQFVAGLPSSLEVSRNNGYNMRGIWTGSSVPSLPASGTGVANPLATSAIIFTKISSLDYIRLVDPAGNWHTIYSDSVLLPANWTIQLSYTAATGDSWQWFRL